MTKERVGLYPGTFDPIHNGHIDIIGRALRLVDRLVIGVAINAGKGPVFTLEERVEMVRREAARLGADGAVDVCPFTGLVVKVADDVGATILFRGLRKRWELAPFLLSLALFLLGMAGLGVSMWPYVVPDALTIWDTAAPESSQVFMLIGVAITLPLILGYTGWAYWVFRGKVGSEGYH